MSTSAGRQSESCFGLDYWLSRCEGFRAESPAGRVGFVEEVILGSSLERPDALVIRTGVFGTGLVVVPIDEVDRVVPRQERVLLRAAPGGSAGLVEALRGRLRRSAAPPAPGTRET